VSALEPRSAGTGDPHAARWLRARAAPVRRLLNVAVGFGTAHAVVVCVIAWLLAHVLSRAIFGSAGLRDLWLALSLIGLFALLRGTLLYRQRMASDAAARAVAYMLHEDLRKQIRRLGPHWCTQQSQGDLITRLVDGMDAFLPYYAGYLPQSVLAAILPVVVLIAVSIADPWSALALAVCAPLVPIFMVLAGRAAADASTRRWLVLRRLGAQFMDAASGLTTLLLCRAGEREQKRLSMVGDAYRRETMAVLRVAFLSSLVMEFFATVSIAVVAVMVGFRLMDAHIAFERGLFALLLAPEFFAPLRAMGAQRHARMEALAAAAGLLELFDQAEKRANAAFNPSLVVSIDAPPSLRFRAVRGGYARDVLHDVDLEIPAGTRLTLVGPSGGGKSTMLALLMGFIEPRSGSVEVDGRNLHTLELATWRRCITWVPQRAHVFRGSVRDNLRIAKPNADVMALERAVRLAAFDRVVARLPQGLDTLLGERGLGLSGGETQRLALARAWLRDAPVLLLDEPTQHLDAATATSIEQSLDALCAGRTVLRIAHRVDVLRDDETIAVLQEGRIVEQGTVGVLRRKDGSFAALLHQDRSA